MSEDPYAELRAAYGSADWEVEERAVQSLLDAYIAPEIRRRQAAGELSGPFRLDTAQVVFYPDDRPYVVRLNSEAKLIAHLWIKPGVTKAAGDPIYEHEVERIEAVELTEEDDPDCAHITLILQPTYRFLALDFIYNKPLVRRHTRGAREFLLAAEHAAEQGALRAFVDNAFSAAELLAKAQLLRLGRDPGFRVKTNHKAIAARFNQYTQFGSIDPQFAAALNRLKELRKAARYLDDDLKLTPDEAQALLQTVREMLQAAERRMPEVEE